MYSWQVRAGGLDDGLRAAPAWHGLSHHRSIAERRASVPMLIITGCHTDGAPRFVSRSVSNDIGRRERALRCRSRSRHIFVMRRQVIIPSAAQHPRCAETQPAGLVDRSPESSVLPVYIVPDEDTCPYRSTAGRHNAATRPLMRLLRGWLR